MKSPTSDTAKFVEGALPPSELLEPLSRRSSEDVRAGRASFDHFPRRDRKMNDMGLFVLGSRARDCPGAGLLIELVPFELSDLFPPLTGQGQEFYDPSVWRMHSAGRENDGRELLVSKDAIATDFSIW
jgi:hypothetical protein